VDWVEADGDYVRLHTGKSSHLHRSTLSALEAQLDPAEFVRIHRSTIVRLARIRELQPYFHGEYVVLLADGTKLKLSRSYRDRLQTALGQPL
jgi:two-component system LytT family response regulator